MPVHNNEIAKIFTQMADMLEIKGANRFRVRAYRNAARTVDEHPRSLANMVERGQDLSRLPGIGKDLQNKIEETTRTGTLSQLKELGKQIPPQLCELLKISDLGPKKVRSLHENIGVDSLEDLKAALKKGQVTGLGGFGKKTEEKIAGQIQKLAREEKRSKLPMVEEVAESLVGYLKGLKEIKDVVVAGSYRRRKETAGDLDVLVTCGKGHTVMEHFVNYENVTRVVSKGDTRSTVRLRSGLQVDLRVVPRASYGAALHCFTGSKAHNIAVRKIGADKGLKINEYGVFKGDNRVAGKTEQGVFKQVGLPYIEPELRENRGEIEAAQKNALPKLVELSDMAGDLHTHTRYTDGHHTIGEMARAALGLGYAYLAISDHSKRVTMVHGLGAKRLSQQISEIDKVNEKINGITILKSIEVDILEDGSLDLPDHILKELDFVIGAIHYKFNLPEKKQTERVIRAMDNPFFSILAHPTGRLIRERSPYEINMGAIMEAARERGCFLELNAHPDRLDLDDIFCKMAREMGIKIAISTDSHGKTQLSLMRFGVYQARRGWLEPGDVINTNSLKNLKGMLNRK